MTYSKFQYCRNLVKEINRLERISQQRAQNVRKDNGKEQKAEQTKEEAQNEYRKIKQEIKDWLKASSLYADQKKACEKYYLEANGKTVDNLEREIKRCLGEI